MTVDSSVVPGLLFLLAELVALAAVGYVIVRTALRETDDRVALAQGLVVGPAIWGVVVNLVMYALPGLAGATAGWIFVLTLAAVLVWRAPKPVRPRLRAAAGFALAAVALFAVALASRQMLGIDDAAIRLGLPASIRAGGFPPELPSNPGTPTPYHYGAALLLGLLAPPWGPDLAFAEELLGAYAWICLALVVATALRRRASVFALLIVIPILLTDGGSTLVFDQPAGIVQAPVPTGIPSAGIRASLTEIYRPAVDLHTVLMQKAPPNITKPQFTLSYALAFIVLARAAHAGRRSWLSVTTLAALVGFLGLTSSTLTPIVFVLWVGLEAIHFIQSRRSGSMQRGDVIRSASGLALATLLLFAGGSFATLLSGGSVTSGLSLGGNEHVEGWRLLGTLDRLPGGVALLGLGPLIVAAVAVLLARRDRLVWALAAGTGLLLLAALLLNYEPAPLDIVRIEGHARNFALFALLIALGVRLARLRPARLRYAAGAARDRGPDHLANSCGASPHHRAGDGQRGRARKRPAGTTGARHGLYVARAARKPPVRPYRGLHSQQRGGRRARVLAPSQRNDVRHRPPQRKGVPQARPPLRRRPRISGRPRLFGAGGRPAARLRIRSRARRVGGEPA